MQKNIAFAAWSEFNVHSSVGFVQQLESREKTSYANSALACFCDAEQSRSDWLSTTFASYAYKIKTGDDSTSSNLL